MNRKYEFTGREKTLNDNGKEVVVKQIRAIRRIPLYDVEEGDVLVIDKSLDPSEGDMAA